MKYTLWVIVIFFNLTAEAQSGKYYLIAPVERNSASLASTSSSEDGYLKDLEWLDSDYYAGKVRMNKEIQASFTFINQSDRPLIIEWVKGSCSCLKTKFSGEPVQPGEKRQIEALLKKQTLGKFSEVIKLKFTHSPDLIQLRVSGDVGW